MIPGAEAKEPERVARMQEQILQGLAALPGVQSVAGANSVTMDGNTSNDPIFAEGRDYREGEIPTIRRFKRATPGLFRTLGNTLVAGRDFTWDDVHSMRDVVIVSENLARELWREPSAALGKRVRERPDGRWREVIGVVGNERDNGADQPAPTIVYWPALTRDLWDAGPRSTRTMAFAVRGPVQSPGFLASVQRAVWSVNATLPLADTRTMAQIQRRSMARAEFAMIMLAIAGAMALLLAVVGIYGVISYAVSQRTREIGIRLALGAEPGAVRGMFLRYGLGIAGIGLVCGLAVAAGASRVLSSLLFEVKPVDGVTFGLTAVVLGLAALCASVLPAARATRVDPVVALRSE
jgi:predicted permease